MEVLLRCSFLFGLVDGRRMSHPDFDPVWARMQALKLSPTFHIGAFAERIIEDGCKQTT